MAVTVKKIVLWRKEVEMTCKNDSAVCNLSSDEDNRCFGDSDGGELSFFKNLRPKRARRSGVFAKANHLQRRAPRDQRKLNEG